MRIALLSGPSGAGKDFVQERITKQFGSRLCAINYDRLYGDAVYVAFPFYTGPRWHHRIWNHNREESLDFAGVFRTTLNREGNSRPNLVLVQGVQLCHRLWRDAILEAIRASDGDERQLFAIAPDAEQLMEQRSSSKKKYHIENADLLKCRDAIERCQHRYQEEPPHFCSIDISSTKEEALRKICTFFEPNGSRE